MSGIETAELMERGKRLVSEMSKIGLVFTATTDGLEEASSIVEAGSSFFSDWMSHDPPTTPIYADQGMAFLKKSVLQFDSNSGSSEASCQFRMMP